MMRRAERPVPNQGRILRKHTRNRINLGRLNSLFKRHLGQNRRQTLGQHGFTRTGRADHQHIMSARSGNFQCAFCLLLPFHVRKIHWKMRVHPMKFRGVKTNRFYFLLTAQMKNQFRKTMHGIHGHIRHHTGLARVRGRNKNFIFSVRARRKTHAKHTVYRPNLTGQRQLPDKALIVKQRIIRQCFTAGKHAHKHGQIERRPLLFSVGGRQIQNNLHGGETDAAVGNGCSNAFFRLFYRSVRQSDDFEDRKLFLRTAFHDNLKAVHTGQCSRIRSG